MKLSEKLLYGVVVPSWGALGMYRGWKWYDYKYQKMLNTTKNKRFYYTEYITLASFETLWGGMVYLIPITFPFVFVKELYRLEVNLRNLTDDKESENYYKLV